MLFALVLPAPATTGWAGQASRLPPTSVPVDLPLGIEGSEDWITAPSSGSLSGASFATGAPPATEPVPPPAEFPGPVAATSSIPVASTWPASSEEPWGWKVLPTGLLYRSYLAGNWEPRLATAWNYTDDHGALWDITLGGRQGILRYGTFRENRPEGVQLDVEGAAITRLDFENELDVSATDYRAGVPLTYARGRWATKLAFYHLSSHLGDEFVLKNPGYPRINYSRNAFVLGEAWWWSDNVRLYGELDYAFMTDGGSKPWGTQMGVEYTPAGPTGLKPVPFWAIHGNLREEVHWGGNLCFQTGWLWRGQASGRLFRVGFDYYNGKSRQLSLFNTFEQQVGLGMWCDY